MKNINNYNQFLFETATEMKEIFNDADILESIVTDSDALLKSIEAQEIDLYTTFELNPDKLKTGYNIEELYDSDLFNSSLDKKGYKKNELESTEETETFIEETVQIKFFSIYTKKQSELEQPKYIVYQSKNKKDSTWNKLKTYSVNGDMQKFYNKLTNKTVEIKKSDKIYIYQTSNSGNDWGLKKNQESPTDTFKDFMTNDEIKAVLVDDDVSITIIA
jgi:hypothetical protein